MYARRALARPSIVSRFAVANSASPIGIVVESRFIAISLAIQRRRESVEALEAVAKRREKEKKRKRERKSRLVESDRALDQARDRGRFDAIPNGSS